MPHRPLNVLVLGEAPELGHQEPAMLSTAASFALQPVRPADEEALDQLLEQGLFDLAVIDGADDAIAPLALLRRIKERWPHHPVLFVTDGNHARDLVEACDLGLDDYTLRVEDRETSTALLHRAIRRLTPRMVPATNGPRSRIYRLVRRYALYHNLLEPFIIVDPNYRVIFFNRLAASLAARRMGHTLAVGQPVERIVLPKLKDRLLENVDRAFAGERPSFRVNIAADEEPPDWREVHFAPVFDEQGSAVAVTVTARDLEELTRVEREFNENKAHFWRFFEALPIGVGIVKLTNGFGERFDRINLALHQLLGYSEADLRDIPPLDLVHEEDRPIARDMLRQLRNGERAYIKAELRLRHKKGHYVWTDIVNLLLTDAQQKPRLIVGMVVDVTERRHMLENLQHSERMRAVGQLAGGISHDFNNILAIVTSYAHILLAEVGDDENLRLLLDRILRAAGRGASLVHRLLAFSEERVYQPDFLNLNELVDESQKLLDSLLGSQVRLDKELAPQLGPIWANRSQIESVITNLVLNARDAMPDGGRILLRTRPVTIREFTPAIPTHARPGVYVSLEVRDTGTGVEPDAQERIFEPFFTTKEVGKGTGLGLSIVYSIVEQLRGFLRIESTPDQGTSICIYIPEASGAVRS